MMTSGLYKFGDYYDKQINPQDKKVSTQRLRT